MINLYKFQSITTPGVVFGGPTFVASVLQILTQILTFIQHSHFNQDAFKDSLYVDLNQEFQQLISTQ